MDSAKPVVLLRKVAHLCPVQAGAFSHECETWWTCRRGAVSSLQQNLRVCRLLFLSRASRSNSAWHNAGPLLCRCPRLHGQSGLATSRSNTEYVSQSGTPEMPRLSIIEALEEEWHYEKVYVIAIRAIVIINWTNNPVIYSPSCRYLRRSCLAPSNILAATILAAFTWLCFGFKPRQLLINHSFNRLIIEPN